MPPETTEKTERTEKTEGRTPTEVLIPEARQHQRRRYRRRSVAIVVALLVAAVLVVSSLLLVQGPGASGHAQPHPVPGAPGGSGAGVVYFRPVLCFAPAYAPGGSSPATGGGTAARGVEAIPACSAGSALTEANLGVTPAGGQVDGFTSHSVRPDPQFAPDLSTSADAPGYATRPVLLPALPAAAAEGGRGARYVLGPAVMSSRDVGRATVVHTQSGEWMVDYTMGAAGSPLWDKVAFENFHRMLAVELNGVVYSAPLIEPMQTSFSSFEGRGEISGGLTHAQAMQLARWLHTPTSRQR
jgi:hypothetical protein